MGFTIFGIILVGLGAALVVKTYAMHVFFGDLPFAEKYLGTFGGSVLAYKLIGLIMIFFFFFLTFGLFGSFIRAVLPEVLFGR